MFKNFSVAIADRRYYVELMPKDEELMRRAAKLLNEKIDKLSRQYDCSAYDHLAMAALLSSIENEETKLQQRYSGEQQEIDQIAASVRKALADDDF